jgi:hypothetical protein
MEQECPLVRLHGPHRRLAVLVPTWQSRDFSEVAPRDSSGCRRSSRGRAASCLSEIAIRRMPMTMYHWMRIATEMRSSSPAYSPSTKGTMAVQTRHR